MKWIIYATITFFSGVLLVTWYYCEKADPKMIQVDPAHAV